MVCSSTCVNATVSTTSRLAFYSFDSVTTDGTGTYNASGIFSPVYVTGWIGSAILLIASNSQRLSAGNIPLNARSFTIEFWFYSTDISSNWDFAFMGIYQAQATDQCLFLNIRYQVPFFGFFNDDTAGATTLAINTWYHIAFVYDNSILRRYIYLNGVLDGQSAAVGALATVNLPFTIGGARIGGSTALDVYYSGYIDHVTVSSRAKSACEVYLDANLACYFKLDSVSTISDSGPNFLTGTNSGATLTTGRVGSAAQFSSVNTFITINGVSALRYEYSNKFTVSMWIYPTSISGGTLVHASTLSNGNCFN